MNKLKSFFKRRFLKFKKQNNLEDFIYLENTKVYETMFYYFHKFLTKDLKKLLSIGHINFLIKLG